MTEVRTEKLAVAPDGSTRPAEPRVRSEERPYAPEKWRTDARIDIDRIEYALEFRRLAGVTQVVPPQDGYLFHNRLTHSMKVASVAATVARQLTHQYGENARIREVTGHDFDYWIDPDFCYAAALAHDIGHPPFGHAGEDALQRLLREKPARADNALHSFEGNAQSTRIVVSLSFRKLDEQGLQLSHRTVAAVAKYPWMRGAHPHLISKLAKKWSFYPEESDVLSELERRDYVAVERVALDQIPAEELAVAEEAPRSQWERDGFRVEKVYRWPEAEIMDWADDVSYAVHDMEDFFMSGLIPLHRLTVALRAAPQDCDWLNDPYFSFTSNDTEVRDALLHARDKMRGTADEDGRPLDYAVNDSFKLIRQTVVDAMPSSRFDGSASAHMQLHAFGSTGIRLLTQDCELQIVQSGGKHRLRFIVPPRLRLVAEFFKALCRFYVIDTSALKVMQTGQKRLISELVEALQVMSLASREDFGRGLPSKLVEYIELRMPEAASEEDLKAAYQLAVVDYVCSLRDEQAEQLAVMLTGRDGALTLPGSWLDT